MPHWGVGARLLSCASVLALSGGFAGGAAAHPHCQSLSGPTTIATDKKCVRVKTTVEGDVVNNAKIGKSHEDRPGFFIGDGGLITGALVNNGTIFGGDEGSGALTLGEGADVQGGIVNNGAIVSLRGSGISLGLEGDDHNGLGHDISHGHHFGHDHGGTEAAALTGDIVNSGLVFGKDYGVVARYGTMSGTLVNEADGVIIGGDIGVFIPDSFTEWTGGIQNSGLIYGGDAGIQIGGELHHHGGEGGEGDDTGVVFSGGIFNYAGGAIISTSGPSIAIGGASFSGGIYNDGLITQYPGDGGESGAYFYGKHGASPYAGIGIVFTAPTVEGGLLNDTNGEIYGAKGPAVWITDKTQSFTGGITNFGTIAGAADAIRIESAAFEGGLYNGTTGVITASEGDAIFATSAWTGDVQNHGLIAGAQNGFAYVGSTFDGDFTNAGTIQGGNVAVLISGQTFDGDFTNAATGVITGGETGVLIDVATMVGDFVNDGAITGDGENTGVHITADGFFGDFQNNGDLDSASDALVLDIGLFDGAFANTGHIAGGENGAVLILGEMTGNFSNSGSIGGETGNGVAINVETWGSQEAPVEIVNTLDGVITGGQTGFALDAGALYGAFTNDGSIAGGTTGASFAAGTFDAPFANSGDIAGGVNGVVMVLENATGGFTNSGSIAGDTGNGVDIVVTTWGSEETRADILNTATGVISGGATGFALDLVTFHGDVGNDGLIEGGEVAVLVSGGTFDGAFTNSSTIDGGATGVAFNLANVTGAFTNSGSINGDTGDGVAIDVDIWGAEGTPTDIVNTATGVITGGQTGFLLDVGTMYGDFINDGVITGNGADTGVHIVVDEFFGDIVNNGALEAPSNALHLVIGTLDGEILNTGTVTASDGAGVAVALDIGNGATFTNTGGGLILGDVVFGGKAPYDFIAENGGVEGDLIGEGGEGNDDTITVQNGTHYFFDGKASNFASFTVADGGAAILGARFEGDAGGGGAYGFSNVDALNVNQGGTLYIDKSTTLDVGSYTQQPGGALEFYLGAPGGDGFSDLTGTVVAGPDDYGQILVEGPVTLDGNIVGFLDPAFASANPSLNQVQYNDVIVAGGGISGDFSTVALISNSSLFELDELIDGNTVDLHVTRISLGDFGLGGVIVNLGGPFDSMVSDRSNGIGSGSCGLASAGDGWCFNRFAANEPGATQVMTDASPGEDPFAWLRTGVRQVGETAVWGRVLGVWGETDGDVGSSGSDFRVAGAIVGADYVFTPILMAGVAAQWTTTDVDFVGRPDNADVQSFEAGAYMSYGDTRLYLNANASVIWHDIEVNRFTPAGRAFGDYDGTTISGFAEVGKTFETEEGFRIQPFVALSYSHLETDAYSETGTGTLLNVSDSEFDSLKSMIGARFAYPIPLDSGRKMVPEARLAWGHEFMDDQASFLATVQGQPPVPSLVLGEKFSRDTAIVGAGVTVPLSDSSSLFVDYDASLNTDITTHTVSAGIRIRW